MCLIVALSMVGKFISEIRKLVNQLLIESIIDIHKLGHMLDSLMINVP